MSTATDTESTNTNNDVNKRLRIDPSAFSRRPTAIDKPRSKSSLPTNPPSPTADAKQQIDDYLASLGPQTQSLLSRIAKPHLKLLLKAYHTEAKIKSFDECITLAEDTENTNKPHWPKSANFKFKLSAPKAVTNDPQFIQLSHDTQQYLDEIRLQLTKRVKASTAIILHVEQQEINASLAHCLLNITIGYLKSTTASPSTPHDSILADAHSIVNSILETTSDTILQFNNGTSLSTFRDGYMTLHGLVNLPEPKIQQIASSPIRRGVPHATTTTTGGGYEHSIDHELLGTSASPPTSPECRGPRVNRTKRNTLINTIRNIFEGILTRPFEIFINQSRESRPPEMRNRTFHQQGH
jgi:hypothetical protein